MNTEEKIMDWYNTLTQNKTSYYEIRKARELVDVALCKATCELYSIHEVKWVPIEAIAVIASLGVNTKQSHGVPLGTALKKGGVSDRRLKTLYTSRNWNELHTRLKNLLPMTKGVGFKQLVDVVLGWVAEFDPKKSVGFYDNIKIKISMDYYNA